MITILQLAIFRGAQATESGSYTLAAIEATGLPFWGGCKRCGACIAAYNASPTRIFSARGFLRVDRAQGE